MLGLVDILLKIGWQMAKKCENIDLDEFPRLKGAKKYSNLLIPLKSFQFQFSASLGKTSQILRNIEKSWLRHNMFCLSVWKKKKFCNDTMVSTDSDKFEAVILSAHSYVLKIMMVNKKKPHPLVIVGGI